jgi:hypothetical protein
MIVFMREIRGGNLCQTAQGKLRFPTHLSHPLYHNLIQSSCGFGWISPMSRAKLRKQIETSDCKGIVCCRIVVDCRPSLAYLDVPVKHPALDIGDG